MVTDLDKLHAVALGTLRDRRCGKTLLRCYDVAGAVALGNPDIVFFVHTLYDIKYLRPMLDQVFTDMDLPSLTWYGKRTCRCDVATIRFHTPDCDDDRLYGYEFVPVSLEPRGL